MKALTKRMLALAGVLAIGLTFARAQSDSALLDALVKKGVLSDQEAEDIRASDAQEYATSPAAKFTLADYITKLTFYGDGRLRYDVDSLNRYSYQNKGVVDRYRYRLRFGLDYNYADNLKMGFELESGTADDSANQTMGATFTNASINVGKIYLQYTPADWATVMVGKFTNPWYETTDTVWSNDENPEGAAEVFNWNIPLDSSSAPVSTDPKALVVAPTPSEQSLSIGLTLVQYDYVTANQNFINNGTGSIVNGNNVGIIGAQVPVEWKITKDIKVKIAPGFTFYTGGGNTDFNGGVPVNYTNNGTPPGPTYFYGTANSSQDPVFYSPKEADDLNIVSAPGEVDFKIGDIPAKVYEDFDWNVTGKQRVQNVMLQSGGEYFAASNGAASSNTASGVFYGSVPSGKTGGAAVSAQQVASQNTALGDNLAWAAGLQIGQNKKKGDWSVLGEFRQVGLGAVDPNINGTDFADSYSNAEGVKTSAVYNFTDFLTGTVTFYDTWAYKNNLFDDLNGGTPSASASGSANNGSTQALVAQRRDERVQVDLGWKF